MVSLFVFLLEPQVLPVLGSLAPLLVEDLRRPCLLRVFLRARSALFTALVLGVPPRPGPPHLQVLPGDVHPDEIAFAPVLQELLVDGLRSLPRLVFVFEAPQRQQLTLVRLGVEDTLLATPDPVSLRMFPEVYAVVGVRHADEYIFQSRHLLHRV